MVLFLSNLWQVSSGSDVKIRVVYLNGTLSINDEFLKYRLLMKFSQLKNAKIKRIKIVEA